jgi:hypothetical protein
MVTWKHQEHIKYPRRSRESTPDGASQATRRSSQPGAKGEVGQAKRSWSSSEPAHSQVHHQANQWQPERAAGRVCKPSGSIAASVQSYVQKHQQDPHTKVPFNQIIIREDK